MKLRRCGSTTLGERGGGGAQSYIDYLVFPLCNLIRRRWDGLLQPAAPATTANEVICAVKMDEGYEDFCAGTHDSLCYNRPAILLEPASVIAAMSHAICWSQTRTRRRRFFAGTSLLLCWK